MGSDAALGWDLKFLLVSLKKMGARSAMARCLDPLIQAIETQNHELINYKDTNP